MLERWCLVMAGILAGGCQGSTQPQQGDAGSVADAPSSGSGSDGSVGGTCTSIKPWCDGAFCLDIPAAPGRAIATPTPSSKWAASAIGHAGEAWFATTRANVIAH